MSGGLTDYEETGIVKIPRWVLFVFLGLFFNFTAIVFAAGGLYVKVNSIQMQLDKLSDEFHSFEGRFIKP